MKRKILFSSLLIGIAMSASASTGLQSVNETASSNYATTKYPILFVHGMFGFTRLGTSSFGLDYFYQTLPNLSRNGATVFAAQVSPLESTEVRGEQLLAQVEEVIAITGQQKINLIGHSHGGPTIRYIEIVKPQYVASLTGVGATFRGSKVADDILSNSAEKSFVTTAVNYLIAPTIQWAESNSSLSINTERSLQSISEAGSAQFNEAYPTSALAASCDESGATSYQGRYYYSWGGTAQLTNPLDLLDVAISTLAPISYKNLDNDGLVSRCSTHFGKVIRDNYHFSHLDEVNQVMGLKSFLAPDPVALYRQHANRLKLQGL